MLIRTSASILRRSASPLIRGTSSPSSVLLIQRHYSNTTSSHRKPNMPPAQTAPSNPTSSFFSNRLKDKVVLITGASGGIGRSTAHLFASLGAHVIITARRLDALQSVAEECRSVGQQKVNVHAATLDMQKRSDIDAFFKSGLPDWAQGKVDILVNNAGLVIGTSPVGEIDPDEIDTMIQTNVVGLIHLTQLLVQDFKKRNHPGHIIQLGSVAGREPYPMGSIYCSTKHAVRAFTTALHRELVNTPIRVSEVQPGMVETNFSVTRFRGDVAAADKVYEGVEALTPEDIAEEIVWIANRPPHVNVGELFVTPLQQASPFHLARK